MYRCEDIKTSPKDAPTSQERHRKPEQDTAYAPARAYGALWGVTDGSVVPAPPPARQAAGGRSGTKG